MIGFVVVSMLLAVFSLTICRFDANACGFFMRFSTSFNNFQRVIKSSFMVNHFSHPRLRRVQGSTLIELLIVMVIIGLLAALVGPKLFGQLEGAKSKTAKAQIEMVATALDAYRLDMNAYPTTEQGIKVLWEKPEASVKTPPTGAALT